MDYGGRGSNNTKEKNFLGRLSLSLPVGRPSGCPGLRHEWEKVKKKGGEWHGTRKEPGNRV